MIYVYHRVGLGQTPGRRRRRSIQGRGNTAHIYICKQRDVYIPIYIYIAISDASMAHLRAGLGQTPGRRRWLSIRGRENTVHIYIQYVERDAYIYIR